MPDRMDKAHILAALAAEYSALEAVVQGLDERRLTLPGVYDVLSVKDVLAHLTAWEQMEVGWLQTSLRGETPVRFLPGFELGAGDRNEMAEDRNQLLDRLNEHIYQQHQDRLLADVLADFRATHQSVFDLVAAMSEDELNDPHRFDWWHGEPIWTSIAGNTWEHLKEHRELIEVWLGRSKGL